MTPTQALASQRKGPNHGVPGTVWVLHPVTPCRDLPLTHVVSLGLLSHEAQVVTGRTKERR